MNRGLVPSVYEYALPLSLDLESKLMLEKNFSIRYMMVRYLFAFCVLFASYVHANPLSFNWAEQNPKRHPTAREEASMAFNPCTVGK